MSLSLRHHIIVIAIVPVVAVDQHSSIGVVSRTVFSRLPSKPWCGGVRQGPSPKTLALTTRQLANAGAPPPRQVAVTAGKEPPKQEQANSAVVGGNVTSVADTRRLLLQHASKVRRLEDVESTVKQPATGGPAAVALQVRDAIATEDTAKVKVPRNCHRAHRRRQQSEGGVRSSAKRWDAKRLKAGTCWQTKVAGRFAARCGDCEKEVGRRALLGRCGHS